MMSDADLAVLFLVTSIGLLVTTIGFAVLWVRARERAIRAEHGVKPERQAPPVGDRIEHLVNAVETMSIEVERISEAQRFTAQVLADRGNASAAKRVPERVITPH